LSGLGADDDDVTDAADAAGAGASAVAVAVAGVAVAVAVTAAVADGAVPDVGGVFSVRAQLVAPRTRRRATLRMTRP
jgi:hypothetical protein